MSDSVEEFLAHYGVLGMKWGVRKGSLGVADMETGRGIGTLAAPGTALLSKKQALKGAQAAEKVARSMLDRETGVLSPKGELTALNVKYAPTFPMKGKTLEAYDKEAATALTNAARKYVPKGADAVVRVSPSEIMLFVGDKETVAKFKEGIKHSHMGDVVCDILRDENGLIINIKPPDSVLQQSETVEEFLAHYGVLGMKWGVRKDRRGGVTPGRFGKSKSTPKKKEASNPRPAWQRAPGRAVRALKPKSDLSEDAKVFRELRERAQKKGLTNLSNDEIRVLTNRAKALDEYKRSFPNTTKKSKKKEAADFFIQDLLVGTGKQFMKDVARDQYKIYGQNKGLLIKKEDKKKDRDDD